MNVPSRAYWANKRVIVTGGNGFLGTHVCEMLRELGAKIFVPRSVKYDLRYKEACNQMFKDFPQPHVVLHLAARVGGIGATAANPAGSFYDNATMGINLIHAARLHNVGKFVCMGSVCAYPLRAPVPTGEHCLWQGYPEETNAPYGVAKRVLHTMLDAYHKQYGMKSVYVLLANLYGPGDDFDESTSHVIPALIKKCVEAKEQNHGGISVWGSGSASRDFLYVKDAAEGILLAAEKLETPEPINIAGGQEMPISGLVELIKAACDFHGDTAYDRSKPDGQPRRAFQTFRAQSELGWQARTTLAEGLRQTVEWYLKQKEKRA